MQKNIKYLSITVGLLLCLVNFLPPVAAAHTPPSSVTNFTANNSSRTSLAASVDSTVNAEQANRRSLVDAQWNSRETSVLNQFSSTDTRRANMLANLVAKGITVTSAQNTETQIQALLPQIKSALDVHNAEQLHQSTVQLGILSHQFTTDIIGSFWQVRENARLARFDRMTKQMQDQLTRLSAQKLDVSGAQSTLSQILAIKPQLQAAIKNQDAATIQKINSQMVSLNNQFRQALHTILLQSMSQTGRISGIRGENRENK
jgi:hypothetical protein